MTNKEKLIKALANMKENTLVFETETKEAFHFVFNACTKDELADVANGGWENKFYHAYTATYGLGETLRFFSDNSDSVKHLYDRIKSLEEDVKERDIYGKACEAQISDLSKEKEQVTKALFDVAEERDEARKQLAEKGQEIIALKAKLYDFMVK